MNNKSQEPQGISFSIPTMQLPLHHLAEAETPLSASLAGFFTTS